MESSAISSSGAGRNGSDEIKYLFKNSTPTYRCITPDLLLLNRRSPWWEGDRSHD